MILILQEIIILRRKEQIFKINLLLNPHKDILLQFKTLKPMFKQLNRQIS